MFRFNPETNHGIAQNCRQLTANRSDQRFIRLRQQRLIIHAAQKSPQHRFARRRATQKLAMDKGASQHGAALASGHQKTDPIRQMAQFCLVINQIDGDRRRVRDCTQLLGQRRVYFVEQRARGPGG